jgi:hypothetical protein
MPVNSNNGRNCIYKSGHEEIVNHWNTLIGAENVLHLEDENAAGEFVAAQIGLMEDRTDLDTIAKDIIDIHGSSAKSTALVKAVLESVSKDHKGSSSVAKVDTAIVPSGSASISRL